MFDSIDPLFKRTVEFEEKGDESWRYPHKIVEFTGRKLKAEEDIGFYGRCWEADRGK